MRIAISGSHRAGKSTLLAELSKALPDHEVVEEPYEVLAEEGYEFRDPPSLEDFEAQLERSLASLREAGDDALFDRGPVDFLAYLSVHEDADALDLERWLPRVRAAVRTLDLIILIPVETPDRIALAPEEDRAWRTAVDESLKEIWLDDPFDLEVEVLEVEGDLGRRAQLVLAQLG